MNNLQISCQGNCFTKPLMCWSLLDFVIVSGLATCFFIIFAVIYEWRKK